jgi:lysophospholipase L1-like esterase
VYAVEERRRSSRESSASSLSTSPAMATRHTASSPTSLRRPAAADVVTLTAGGNDLLLGHLPRTILRQLHHIAVRIQPLGARVVINTIYDPSDRDNAVGRRELGLSRLATIELRRRLNTVNRGIAKLAREHGFLLADLERLFHGHGITSNEPWFVQVIEPNLAGASAIAEHWYELLTSQAPAPVYLERDS